MSSPAPAAGAPRAIALIGPMAAGKTKIGRRVAKTLGRPFVDTDARIVAEHGAISALFAERGEDAFREIEREAVAAALAEPAVVSLGGGAILDAGTRALLAELPVIYLTVTEEAVRGRINGAKRPLLRDDPGAWARIFAERRPLYEEVATVTFDTSVGPITPLGERISAWAKEHAL